jgi:uncharacterized cupin superfamily protein
VVAAPGPGTSRRVSDYTLKNLDDVEDQAAKHGLGPALQARFAHGDLGCEQTGVSLQRLAPDERHAFAHRHENAEEVVVVLAGSGQALLDGETVPLRRLDALRVGPSTVRSFAAGPDGIEYLVFGPHHAGDAETLPAEWPG